MRSFKLWLFERFLPEYYREEMTAENHKLKNELKAAEDEISRLRSYINGMHTALRAGRKIVIKNGGVTDGVRERNSEQQ